MNKIVITMPRILEIRDSLRRYALLKNKHL